MSFLKLVETRESCRLFNGDQVSLDALEKLIEIARLAPSACNGQPWHFTVMNDSKMIEVVSASMQAFNQKAGAFIVITEENTKLIARAGEVIKDQCYRSIDIGIVTAYITLAATEMGISNCIIGWFNEKKVKKALNIPSKKRVRLIISLGYTDETKIRPKKRKEMSEIVNYLK